MSCDPMCPFLACAACSWQGGDPQGTLITAGQNGFSDMTDTHMEGRMHTSDKAIPRSRIWRSGSTGDLTDMEVSAVPNRTPLNALQGKSITTPDGCHVWQRATNNRDYGVVWFDGKLRLAHRVAFLAKHGRWPAEGMVTDHACDNKACINPDHLREMENWRNVRRAATPAGTDAQRERREMWRRANARRRNYSESWTPEGGE